jgi:hypothetical protein
MDANMVFTVKDKEYSAGKLDAKRQFHVLRRLAPLLGGVVAHGGVNMNEDEGIGEFLNGIGTLPDDAADYVLDHCLSVVKRNDGGAWCAITAAAPNGHRVMQYDDMDMIEMLTVVFYVLRHNISGFFDALPSDLEERLRGAISAMSR